jgi:mitogen-activated protein kinase kinase kinase
MATRVANWYPDIKGANILVDNRGCIKLADFGASKKVVKLGTISGMKEG